MLTSIVIRARNCADELRTCLSLLKDQIRNGVDVELVVVDNESHDSTAKIALEYGARVIPIAKIDFSWGRALNLGIRASNGEIVILLSSDTEPRDPNFLLNITSPFRDGKVASVYGRQLPKSDAPIEEIFRLRNYFPDEREVFTDRSNVESTGHGMIVSNACAAIRRSVWEQFQYDEMIEGGEEGIWTKTALDRGYLSIYEPTATVYHSHNDPILRGAIRRIELYQKNLKLKARHSTFLSFLRYLLSVVKHRIKVCLAKKIPAHKRLQGIIHLPFELIAILTVYLLLKSPQRALIRKSLWDFKFIR